MSNPMMRPSRVSYGDGLAAPEHRALREKIAALARDLLQPLHADTLLNAASRLTGEHAMRGEPSLFLLVDFHRVFLYDEPAQSVDTGIDSVLRYIADAYPVQPIADLIAYFDRHAFPILFELDDLDVLKELWATRQPGWVVTLDHLTGEVRRAPAHRHPEAGPVSVADRQPAIRSVATLQYANHRMSDRMTDHTLRVGQTPLFDGLESPDVGIIRGRKPFIGAASLPTEVTTVAWRRGKASEACGGKSFRPSDASLIASCEAIERFQVLLQGPDDRIVYGSYANLQEDAVNPATLFFRRLRAKPKDWRVEYDDDLPLYWTWAYEPLLDRMQLVPAQEVWFNTVRLAGERICTAGTTNACAIGSCFEEAALHATLEAIERDSFLVSWYLRRRSPHIRPETVEFEPFQLLLRRWRAAFAGYSLHLFDVTTDVGVPTVVTVAVRRHGEGPKAFFAAAARLSAERALTAAVKELSAFDRAISPQQNEHNTQLALDPTLVVSAEDHYHMYSSDEAFDHLAFWDFDSPPTIDAADTNARAAFRLTERCNLRDLVLQVAARLEDVGARLLLKNISHPTFATRGACCVRALTPGLYPMWFGYHHVRFAETARLRRMADRAPIAGDPDYNLDVHPFP